MKRVLAVLALLVLTSGLALADGPETGVVSGRVTNAQGEALPGVLVSIEGDRGAQTTTTDETGNFRFALLVPGSYLLKGTLEGFKEASAGLNVTAGGKVEYDLQMNLETAETITVTSEAPMVDKFNVTAGATVTSEVGAQAAGTTRTYYGVINMLPGVTSDADNRDISEMRPSVNGGHFADQSVYIDGVDTTFSRLGGSRVILPTTATTEVTMEAGGAGAEYGRVVGSSTNVIVKSGTNNFHGEVVGLYADQSWYGEYKDQPVLETLEHGAAPRDFLKQAPIEKDQTSESYELSVGGPIVRDKAWFFAAYTDSSTGNFDKTFNGDLIDASIEYESTVGKVNFQPSAKHQLSATYIDAPIKRVYTHTPSADQWTPTPHDLSGDMANLSWNFSVSQDLFLETKVATQTSNENKYLAAGGTDVTAAILEKQTDPRFPGDPNLASVCQFSPRADARCNIPGNNYAVYSDNLDSGSWHNGWILDNGFGLNEYPRDQANVSATWFVNENHETKFGIDWQEVKWLQDVRHTSYYDGPGFSATAANTAVGGAGYTTPCGVALGATPGHGFCFFSDYNPADVVARGRGSSDSSNENSTLYGRDRFTIGEHWTFNAGLRWSMQENLNDVDHKVVDTDTLEPRLAVSYDVKGDSTMLFTVNVGRYYAQLNQQFTNEWLMEEWNGWNAVDDFLYCDGTDVFLSAFVPALASCSAGIGYNFVFRSFRPGEQFDLAEQGIIPAIDLDPYFKDEIIAGFEWQATKNWALDVKGIYWELGDIIMNTTQRWNSSPGLAYNLQDTFDLSVNDKNFKKTLRQLGLVPEEIIDDFEEPFKEYTALQLQFNRRFANGWALYNNLTLAKLETTGSGAWWNNTSSSYAEDLGVVLTPGMIASCQSEQATRIIPMDCSAELAEHLGEPVSTIHRAGRDGLGGGTGAGDGFYGSGVDRPFIWKTFGFKQFTFGKMGLNVGGLLTIQDGAAWGRGEQVDAPSGNDPIGSVYIPLEANGDRRLDPFYDLNLTLAFTFPIVGDRVKGNLRIEGTNVTNEQEQINTNLYGEPLPVRREFQRPATYRAMFGVNF
jgi:hypothetical protein